VLLSGGVGFDDFVRQTAVSCRAGCSGVMVGRAVWMEAIALQGKARENFLRDTGVDRMQILADICAEYGRSWTSLYPNLSEQLAEGWYRDY
jgi:tagatose-1,6-bisphosphate aldolase